MRRVSQRLRALDASDALPPSPVAEVLCAHNVEEGAEPTTHGGSEPNIGGAKSATGRLAPRHTVLKGCRLTVCVAPKLTNLNSSRRHGAHLESSTMLNEDEADQSCQSSSDGSDEDQHLPAEQSDDSGAGTSSGDDDVDRELERGSSSSETEESDDGAALVIRCTVCHRGNRSAEMVLCDHCDAGVHLSCHEPPMSVVPTHDFFCSRCCVSVEYADSFNGCLPPHAQVSFVLGELLNNVVASCWREALAAGGRCDVLDRTGTWYNGRVVQKRQNRVDSSTQCLIHFDGWSTRLNEWIPIDSDRLQMLGSQDRTSTSHTVEKRRQSGSSQNPRRRHVRTSPDHRSPPKQHRGKRKLAAQIVDAAKKSKINQVSLVKIVDEQQEIPADIQLQVGLKASISQRRNPLQPFCLFENVANMPKGEIDRATEQLKMPFTIINSGDISAASRARCYWSNCGFPPEFSSKNLAQSPPLTIGEFIGKTTLATLKWPVRISVSNLCIAEFYVRFSQSAKD
jgi:hypothetical protein